MGDESECRERKSATEGRNREPVWYSWWVRSYALVNDRPTHVARSAADCSCGRGASHMAAAQATPARNACSAGGLSRDRCGEGALSRVAGSKAGVRAGVRGLEESIERRYCGTDYAEIRFCEDCAGGCGDACNLAAHGRNCAGGQRVCSGVRARRTSIELHAGAADSANFCSSGIGTDAFAAACGG